MREEKDSKDGCGLFIFSFVMGLMLGFGVGGGIQDVFFTRPTRQQAVERGFAEWKLIHAHDGKTEFRWLEKPVTPTAEQSKP